MTGPAASPTLARVAKGRLCSGCGGCALAAPGKVAMALSDEGFLRPRQSHALQPAEERRIAEACPGATLELPKSAAVNDTLWGPLIAVRQGYARDARLRHRASSGGLLSALLIHLLESGSVDFVLQIEADPDNPLGNRTRVSRNAAEVLAAAGSRYAPSAPLAVLEPHLEAGARFAFVGKPCDVAALRVLAKEDTRIDRCIPFMLSFFCAGVPSQRGAEKLLAKMGVAAEAVTDFRYRGNGWPGYATAVTAEGREARMSYHESWGGVLSAHLQFRCKICPDGTGGFADVACADAWHCDARGYPLFEEAEGISLLVTRSEAGEALVRAALAAGSLVAEPLEAAAIAAMQPGQTGRKTVLLARLAALTLLFRPRPRYRGLRLLQASLKAKPRLLLKNFLGTGRRLILGRY
ncbi:MAG: hypothetical protein Kilf2KO_06300 [Rhodospirillales bacterium]